MRQPLLAFSLCCLSKVAFAQDPQPTSEPTSIPIEIPVEAPPVQGLSGAPVPPPRETRDMSFKREMRNTSGFSVNLIGLQNSFDINWSKPLFDTDNVLLSGAHIAVGLNNSTSPAYTRIGGWVEFSPLSIVDFRFGIEPAYYFGSFSTIINFESYASPYSEAAIAAIDDQSAPGVAGRAYFEPTFKVKAGPIIAASYADFELWKLATIDVAPDFFYESQRDTLVDSSGDLVIQGANVLLYEYNINEAAGRKLIAGLNHEYLNIPGKDNGNRRQTLGLLAVANLSKTMGSLYKPTVIVKVFTYLQDRNDLEKLNEVGAQFAFRFYIGPPRP
jgi:hypothetical protein